jgi:hypothetical protein
MLVLDTETLRHYSVIDSEIHFKEVVAPVKTNWSVKIKKREFPSK